MRRFFTMKNKFGLRVLALALTLGLVPALAVSALDDYGLFTSTGDRDAWILETLKEFPCYFAAAGGSISKIFAPVALESQVIRGGDIFYRPEEAKTLKLIMVLIAKSPRGAGGCMITFCKKEDVATYIQNTAKTQPGANIFGPFEAGATDAARKAALGRITAGIIRYIDTNDTEPWK
jgi:hypothetical protein